VAIVALPLLPVIWNTMRVLLRALWR
jgi:hypothetical protein